MKVHRGPNEVEALVQDGVREVKALLVHRGPKEVKATYSPKRPRPPIPYGVKGPVQAPRWTRTD